MIVYITPSIESASSEYDSEAEEEDHEEAEAAIIELEIKLDNGLNAKLQIFKEEKFEEDILDFTQKHNLDDLKRKKIMKIVKLELLKMVEEGQLGGDADQSKIMNDDEDGLDEKNKMLLDELNLEIERANEMDNKEI